MVQVIPQSEIGWAGSGPTGSGFWSSLAGEDTPELQWPRSVATYRRMRKEDPQVVAVTRAVTLPVRRTAWKLDAEGCRPEVTALCARSLGLPVVNGPEVAAAPRVRTRDRFSWSAHLANALRALDYGHMFFEQQYRENPGDGLFDLRKLAPRMPATIARIDVARDGGLVSITQSPQLGMAGNGLPDTPEPIPVTRLVAYVFEQEAGEWLGNSLLRPAYKHWLLKDRELRRLDEVHERNGMGVPLYEGAEKETDLSKGRRLAEGWRSGRSAGAAIANGAKLRLVGVEGAIVDPLPTVRYHDESIGRAVLAHFLNLGGSTGGSSYALGSTFADFFVMSLQTVGEWVRDTAQAHVIEDLVDVNFGPTEPAPRLIFDEIGSRRDATAEAVRALLDSGAVTADTAMEQWIRSAFGLPAKVLDLGSTTPAAEPAEAPATPAATTTTPGAAA